MKIKLSANSLAAKKELEKLNLECGYSYTYGGNPDEELNTENSWIVKLLSKLETYLPNFKEISGEEKKIIHGITNSTKFLHEQYTGSLHTQNMHVAMNLNSPVNKFAKKSLNNLKFKEFINEDPALYKKVSLLREGLDDNAGHVFSHTKKIVLGTSLFLKNAEEKENSFTNYLIEKLGLEKTIDFIVFHEASHSFEHVNKKSYGIEWDQKISDLYPLTSRLMLNYKESEMNILNKNISDKSIKEIPLVDPCFMEEINSLHKEIYADVGAILLLRNKDIIEKKYSKESIESILNNIIESRQCEQDSNKLNMYTKSYVSIFNHFTSPGLEYFKSQINELPEKVLSQEEIHYYAQNAVKKGVARVLVASSMANNENIGQLKILFYLNNDGDDFKLPDTFEPHIFKDKMMALKELAGEDWGAKFHKNIELIKELNPSNKMQLIWQAGVNQKMFEKTLAESIHREKEIDELLDFLETPSKVENKSAFAIKDKSAVTGVLSTFRNQTKDNKSKLEP